MPEGEAKGGDGAPTPAPLFRMIYNGEEQVLGRCRASAGAGAGAGAGGMCELRELLAELGGFALPVDEWAAGPCQLKEAQPSEPLLSSSGGGAGSGFGGASTAAPMVAMVVVVVIAIVVVACALNLQTPLRRSCHRRAQYTEIGGSVELPHVGAAVAGAMADSRVQQMHRGL